MTNPNKNNLSPISLTRFSKERGSFPRAPRSIPEHEEDLCVACEKAPEFEQGLCRKCYLMEVWAKRPEEV